MTTTFVDVLLDLRHPVTDEVLAGGKIYTFEAGTDTPLVTFQDLDGEVENTNPVILDDAGMAVIRQTDGVSYKWVVTDENDVLLFTRDDITVGFDGGEESIYPILLNFIGSPTTSQFMGGDIMIDDVQMPADFAGARGWVQTAPADDYVVSFRVNGSEAGTITIDTDGLYTFETSGNDPVALVVDDVVTFYGPSATDTASGFIIKLVGGVI